MTIILSYMEELRNKINEANKTLKCRYGNILKGKKPGNKYYDLLNEINTATSHLPTDIGISVRIYYIFNGTIDPAPCMCGCGQPVNKLGDKYLPHHHENDPDNKKKQVSTFFKNHGGKGTDAYKKVLEKKDATSIKRFETLENKRNHVKNKVKETCQKKYNKDNVFQIPEIKESIKQQWQENKESILAKRKIQWNINFYKKLFITGRFKDKFIPMFNEYKGIKHTYRFKCKKCGNEVESHLNGREPRCLICQPFIDSGGQSLIENELIQYVRSIYHGIVLSQNRSMLKTRELDIFIPEKNLGIELCGLYWHSEKAGNKNNDYHLDKLNRCEQIGIRLVTIFEDEWYYKNEIVKSYLKHIIDVVPRTLQIKNYEIKIIENELAISFMEKYHINGYTYGTENIGLFYKNRLVSMLMFKKIEEQTYEIMGYCSLFHFNILDSFNILINHFINIFKPKSIMVYSDRRYDNGEKYIKFGFKHVCDTQPHCTYFKNQHHIFRYAYDEIQPELLDFNPSLSDWENMQNNKYDRIFDCGQSIYRMEL